MIRHPLSVALAAGACCAALPVAALAQLTVGPNVNLTRLSGEQAEGMITIDPSNPNRIFMIANNLAANTGMARAYSLDGGTTWTRDTVFTSGASSSIGDPSCAYDSFGNLFACHLSSGGVNTLVNVSTDGGVTFGAPVTIATSTDQPTIVVGPGVAWVTYDKNGGMNVSGASVTGLGLVGAFSAPILLPQSNTGISGGFGEAAVGPGGRVGAVYQHTGSGQGPDNAYFNFNPTGLGGVWAPRLTVTPTNVGGFDFIPAQSQRSIDSEVSLQWDYSGGPFNGRLYLVYTDETVNENNDTEIRFRFSDTNGTTWSAPVRLNDDPVGVIRSQFLPRMAIDRATGHLAVAWYDARNDASNIASRIYMTASTDGGATWLPNVQVSQGTSNSTLVGGFDFGDYIGIAMHNDVIFPLWSDNSNSTGDNPNGTAGMDMYTARVTLAAGCYANCDASTTPPVANVADFTCFLQKFAANDPYANCDASTAPPVINVADFTCFLQKFAAGCP